MCRQIDAAMANDSRYSSVPGLSRVSDADCFAEYSASLKCLDDFNYDKSKCQHQFDVYKECRKKEREVRLERNKKRSFFQ